MLLEMSMNKFFELLSDAFEIFQMICLIGLAGILLVGGGWFAILFAMVVAGIPVPMLP